MAQRVDLQDKLRTIAPKVWYQRPPSNKMSYPCIIYKRTGMKTARANNHAYLRIPCYEILYIAQEDSDGIEDTMLDNFEHCSFDQKYVSDNLYHYAFTIYF